MSGKRQACPERSRAGTILLLALLVMSGVLVVGSSLGTISVLSLRQSRIIDDSVVAFGAAETAAEQTLYQIRRLAVSLGDLNGNPAHDSSASFSGPPMTNDSSWSRSLTASEPTLFASIPKDKVYEIVLWDPENPGQPAGVESLAYAWDDDCGGTSSLEVLATGWDPSAAGAFAPEISMHGDSPILTYIRPAAATIDNGFSGSRAYRVRLRARTCDIFDLAVSAYAGDNASGGLVEIPSRISVSAEGTFGSARQAVEIRLPRLHPLSGAFDFVVFSQCSILKGASGAPCP